MFVVLVGVERVRALAWQLRRRCAAPPDWSRYSERGCAAVQSWCVRAV